MAKLDARLQYALATVVADTSMTAVHQHCIGQIIEANAAWALFFELFILHLRLFLLFNLSLSYRISIDRQFHVASCTVVMYLTWWFRFRHFLRLSRHTDDIGQVSLDVIQALNAWVHMAHEAFVW